MLYLPAVILTLGYLYPIHPKASIRRLPFIKIFLISTCWMWITATVPLLLHGKMLWEALTHPISWERFAFIFALTIPFDIRDTAEDARTGLKTLPNTLGLHITKAIGILAAGLWILLHYVAIHRTLYSYHTLLATVFTALLTVGLILRATPARSKLYFTGYVDGMMLVWVLLMEILHNILVSTTI